MGLATYYAPSVGRPEGEQYDRWYRETDETRQADAMVATCQRIERDQSLRFDELLIYGSLYSGRMLSNLYQFAGAQRNDTPTLDVLGHRVTFNVGQSCVDTAAAKIAKNKPRSLFLTQGGNWSQQRKAKDLTKYVDGLFYENEVYAKVSQPVFRDSCIFDGGVAQVFVDPFDGKVTAERVLPFEILVDEIEGLYGAPRTMYRRKFYPRDVLLEWFGRKDEEKRARIKDARGVDPTRMAGGGSCDMIPTYEGWRLGAGGKDKGLHLVAIEGCRLDHGEWTKQRFPFAKLTWNDLPTGYWGQGLIAQLAGIQIEMNKLLRSIQRAQHHMSVPRWTYPKGSQVVPDHIDNHPDGSHISYTGAVAPQAFVAPAMSAEVYQWVEQLYQKAFETTGISMLSSVAAKPAGLNAAVALREYHDIESERFVIQGQRYEQFHLELAGLMIDAARDAYQNNKDLRVRAPGTKLLESIAWKDVDLSEDSYVMKQFPTSILPTTPAGRLQKVQELIDSGLLPREFALDLLDFPDIEGAVSLQVAGLKDIERILERIIEKNDYETPDEHMNLDLAVQRAHSAFLRARADGAPAKVLDRLSRFIEEAHEVKKQLAPPPAPPALAPPMGPEVMGAPPGMPPGLPPGMPVDPAMMPPMPLDAGSPAVPSELPA